MRRFLAAALAVLAAPAAVVHAVELTVNAAASGLDPTRQVRIVSRGVGGGSLRACQGVLFRDLTLTGGTATTDLPATSTCGFQQEYAAIQGDTTITFSMPATASDLSSLRVVEGERGPCTVSRSEPQAPSPGDLWCHPSSGELQFRADGTWSTVGGGGGGAIVANGSITEIKIADGAVSQDKLSSQLQTLYGGAVKLVEGDQPSLNGRDLEFISVNESATRSLSLPGITVEDGGTRQGNPDEVHTLDCTGALDCSVTATKATLSVTPYDDGPLDARVDALELTDQELHSEASIVSRVRTVFQARNTAYAITGASVPTDEAGRKLEVVIQIASEADRRWVVDLTDLLALGKVTGDNGAIGSTNALRLDLGDDTWWIGVDTQGDVFMGTTEAGNIPQFVSINDLRNDVEPYARRSQPTVRLPAARLPATPPAGWGTGTSGTGGITVRNEGTAVGTAGGVTDIDFRGLTVAATGTGAASTVTVTGTSSTALREAAEAAVAAEVDSVAIHDSTARWPASKVPEESTRLATRTASGLMSGPDKAKLDGVAAGAEVNVQPDWNQGSSAQDSFIRNKPSIITAAERTKVARLPAADCVQGQIWKRGTTAWGCAADATAAGEAVSRSQLAPVSVASSTTSAAGTIENQGGALEVLVAGTEDPHVYRGTVATLTGGYIGDSTFSWVPSPFALRANLSRAIIGASPPATLYLIVRFQGGFYEETNITRQSSGDTAQTWRYVHSPGEPGFDTLAAGDWFAVSFYSDEARATAFRIQPAATNRWEDYLRDVPHVDPVAVAGSDARWPATKVPAESTRPATASAEGLMSAGDKAKLDRYPSIPLTRPTPTAADIGRALRVSGAIGERDAARGVLTSIFDPALSANIGGVATDGTHFWIVDTNADSVLAFLVATGARDSSRDITATAMRAAGGASVRPQGAAWWNDELFIADRAGRRILAFSTSATVPAYTSARSVPTATLQGIFSSGFTLWGLAVSQGRLYVADSNGDAIGAIDLSDLTHDSDWDIPALQYTRAVGGTVQPFGLAADSARLYVVDGFIDTVSVWDLTGTSPTYSPGDGLDSTRVAAEFGGSPNLRGATVSGGHFYLVDSGTHTLAAFSLYGDEWLADPPRGTPPAVQHAVNFREEFPGLTISRTDTSVIGTPLSLSRSGRPVGERAFVVSATENSAGEFHLSLEVTIAPVSDVNMGWRQGGANQTTADRQRALSNTLYASDLREEEEWTASTADSRDNGLTAFSLTAYSGATPVGTYTVLLIWLSGNQVGIYPFWTGAGGATGATITAEFRGSFFGTDSGGGAAAPAGDSITTHTSLASLPTSGMTVGDRHRVTEGSGATASVTEFVAVSATQLKCTGGLSADLVNRNVGTPAGGTGGSPISIPTARVWHRIPISGSGAPYATWDYRFPMLHILMGGRNNTAAPWNFENTWHQIDTATIQGLTASTAGATQATGQFIEIGRFLSSTIYRVVAVGRTSANEILVNLHDTALQAFPFRIRGGCG